MIDPNIYKMAVKQGGTPEEIMERAEKLEEIFGRFGLVIEQVEDSEDD